MESQPVIVKIGRAGMRISSIFQKIAQEFGVSFVYRDVCRGKLEAGRIVQPCAMLQQQG